MAARDHGELTSLAARASAQEDPEEALRAVTRLREELDRLEAQHVEHALRGGATWSRIATALGISKQAAHKRHRGGRAARNGAAPPVRISDQARRAISLGREEAARVGAPAIGTEHLLLGVLRLEGARTTRALEGLGITLKAGREVLERAVGASTAGNPPAGLSRYARVVLERALRDTAGRRQDRIDLAGLVAALLVDDRGGAARLVDALGIAPEVVRRRVGAD